jgi:subtilisin family serine protease
MSRAVILLALSLLAHVTTVDAAVVVPRDAPSRSVASPPVPGRVLVVDDAGTFRLEAHGELRATRANATAVLERHGLTRGARIARGSSAVAGRFLVLASARPDFDPARAAAELRASGLVRAAVPDLRVRLHVLPNDPDLAAQWWVDDGGVADVRLPAAWDVEQGNAAVRIGVMDTGVDLGHPDLASRVWTNPGEVPANGLDDDGNGYTDDVHGWDFGDDDADPNPHYTPDAATFDVDIGFHGTFVAGLAAAATNNAEGIAGAAWNGSVVPLKVVDSAAEITLAAMTEAFLYATAMQVEVLNMSLGTAEAPGVAEYFQALVDDAIDAGVVCVASAGNSGTSDLNFPAACAGVLSTAATDAGNARATFSNFGATVKIAAPGAGMWSAICRNYPLDDLSQIFYEVFFGWDAVRPYMGGDGTSFSAPLVSGVAALVRSRHPAWTPAMVASHLVATGDVVAYDEPIGPRLNAHRAVTEDLLSVPLPGAGDGVALMVGPNPATAAVMLRFALAAPGRVRLRVHDLAGRLVRELADGEFPAGPGSRHWDGTDAGGRPVSAGMYIVRMETAHGVLLRKVVRTH